MPAQPTQERTVILKDEGLRRLEGFTQIPNVVLTHPAMSGNAKITYGVLLSYAWQKEFCWPAQERLAQDMNCSVRTVQRYLTELEQGGLIRTRRRGLNRPNIYEILPVASWHSGPKSLKNKDTTDLSHPDTTHLSSPEATPMSPQEATILSPKEDSRKNTQTVVNVVTPNDPETPLKRNRTQTISDRALRSKYDLDDHQIVTVHRLVDKELETLGAGDRNFAAYVKRAAEAVRDGLGDALDFKLSDFKQAATEIAIASRPAYFHAMWVEESETRRSSVPDPPPSEPAAIDPRIARLIVDAERRGFPVPAYIRTADIQAVNRWWAALATESEKRT